MQSMKHNADVIDNIVFVSGTRGSYSVSLLADRESVKSAIIIINIIFYFL